MEGYSVTEAASILGVPTERVWELLARGVLSGAPEGDTGMRVYLQPRPAPAPPAAEAGRPNGDGGPTEQRELSPFRELLTEFRNLTERYGQALLALGEARGEVAALRSRVDLLEARMDLRLPMAPGGLSEPGWGSGHMERAATSAPAPARPDRDPPATVPHPDEPEASEDEHDRPSGRRRSSQRRATEAFAEALARADDPTRPELPGAAATAAAMAALRDQAVVEAHETQAEAILPRELPAADSIPSADEVSLSPPPVARTEVQSEPEPELEPQPEPEVPIEAEPPSEPEPEPEAEPRPELDAEAAPEAQAEPEAPPEPETRLEPEAQPEPEVPIEAQPPSEPEQAQPEPDAQPEPEPQREPEPLPEGPMASEAQASAPVASEPLPSPVEPGEPEPPVADVAPPLEDALVDDATEPVVLVPEPVSVPYPEFARAVAPAAAEEAAVAPPIDWDPDRYTVTIEEPDWFAGEVASPEDEPRHEPEPKPDLEPEPEAETEAGPEAEPEAETEAEPQPAQQDAEDTGVPEETAQEPTPGKATTVSAAEETMLWFGQATQEPAAAESTDEGADEMEVAGGGRGSVGRPMPGSSELDDALAALDALARRAEPPAPEPKPAPQRAPQPEPEAVTPSSAPAWPVTDAPAERADDPWIPSEPATERSSVTPASRAYRRLRRIFPG